MPQQAKDWAAHLVAQISLSPSRGFVDVVGGGFGHASPQSGLGWIWPQDCPLAEGGKHRAHKDYIQPRLISMMCRSCALGVGEVLVVVSACGVEVSWLNLGPIGRPNLLTEAVRGGVGLICDVAADVRGGAHWPVARPLRAV